MVPLPSSRLSVSPLPPLVLRELQAFRVELLLRIDAAEHLVPQFVRGLYLPRHLRSPFARHMAVGADRPHPGAILVVHRLFVFLVDGVAHFMTGDAEPEAGR